jgi:hypothetical protein
MTDYRSLRDSDWLGQWDIEGHASGVNVVIASVDRFVPEGPPRKRKRSDGKMVDAPCKRLDVGFRGKRKHWLPGPVSQAILQSLFGRHIEDWIGKPICIYADADVMMGGKKVGGIRCRASTGAPTADALDQPVDKAKQALLDQAAGREPGQEG